MKEQEHKREIEKLWAEKLAVYRVQRDMELEEKKVQEEETKRKLTIVDFEKERLIKEHGQVLQQYHPKAATAYGGFKN